MSDAFDKNKRKAVVDKIVCAIESLESEENIYLSFYEDFYISIGYGTLSMNVSTDEISDILQTRKSVNGIGHYIAKGLRDIERESDFSFGANEERPEIIKVLYNGPGDKVGEISLYDIMIHLENLRMKEE